MRGKKGRRQGRRLLNLKKIAFGKPRELSANINGPILKLEFILFLTGMKAEGKGRKSRQMESRACYKENLLSSSIQR